MLRWDVIIHRWPLGALALVGAAVYATICIAFESSFGAFHDVASAGYSGHGAGGPYSLCFVVSVALGWAAVELAVRQIGVAGPLLWIYAALIWVPAIAMGLGVVVYATDLPAYALVASAIVTAFGSAFMSANVAWRHSL